MLRAINPGPPPHDEFSVDWLSPSVHETAKRFKGCLDTATSENDVQAFLESNPALLALHLGGGRQPGTGKWCSGARCRESR